MQVGYIFLAIGAASDLLNTLKGHIVPMQLVAFVFAVSAVTLLAGLLKKS